MNPSTATQNREDLARTVIQGTELISEVAAMLEALAKGQATLTQEEISKRADSALKIIKDGCDTESQRALTKSESGRAREVLAMTIHEFERRWKSRNPSEYPRKAIFQAVGSPQDDRTLYVSDLVRVSERTFLNTLSGGPKRLAALNEELAKDNLKLGMAVTHKRRITIRSTRSAHQ